VYRKDEKTCTKDSSIDNKNHAGIRRKPIRAEKKNYLAFLTGTRCRRKKNLFLVWGLPVKEGLGICTAFRQGVIKEGPVRKSHPLRKKKAHDRKERKAESQCTAEIKDSWIKTKGNIAIHDVTTRVRVKDPVRRKTERKKGRRLQKEKPPSRKGVYGRPIREEILEK